HKFEAHVELIADSSRSGNGAVQAEMWDAAFQTGPQLGLQFGCVLSARFPLLPRVLGRNTGADNCSNVLCPGPPPIFLNSAMDDRTQSHSPVSVKHARSLWSVESMRRQRQQSNIHRFHIDAQPATAVARINE